MQRLIDANKLLKSMAFNYQFASPDMQQGIELVREEIKAAPTVKSSENSGEWISKGPEYDGLQLVTCSCCGYGVRHQGKKISFKHCPECGAKMDGENK